MQLLWASETHLLWLYCLRKVKNKCHSGCRGARRRGRAIKVNYVHIILASTVQHAKILIVKISQLYRPFKKYCWPRFCTRKLWNQLRSKTEAVHHSLIVTYYFFILFYNIIKTSKSLKCYLMTSNSTNLYWAEHYNFSSALHSAKVTHHGDKCRVGIIL